MNIHYAVNSNKSLTGGIPRVNLRSKCFLFGEGAPFKEVKLVNNTFPNTFPTKI